MKRMACIALVVCLLPVCAFALDLDDFNVYAYIFGEEELQADNAITENGFTIFQTETCKVTFNEDKNRIIVDGDGIPFLAYAMAAIMQLDPDSSNYSDNAGRLLSSFLLCRTSGEGKGATVSGGVFLIQKDESGYIFTVGK